MSSNLYQELQWLLKPEPRVSAPAEDSLSLYWSSCRSSSALSLQMCTESLGSETGSDVSDELISISPALGGKKPAPRSALFSKKQEKSGCFPPPLTTSGGFHMRPHREDGRLVIEAMSVSSWRSALLVERSDGRIRVGVMSEEEDDTEEEEPDDDNGEGEEIEGNGEIIVEGEMGSEKFARPMRCKERGLSSNYESLGSWPKPFLVAT